jgi:hypothetical protein
VVMLDGNLESRESYLELGEILFRSAAARLELGSAFLVVDCDSYNILCLRRLRSVFRVYFSSLANYYT